jgi:hypothetical protein
MANTISSVRFRLLCREVALKVNARRGRGETTREAVLRELLRRVESHLGRKPGVLVNDSANPTKSIAEAMNGLFDASTAAAWPLIAEEELLRKVVLQGDEGESRGSQEKGSRHSGA